MKELAVFFLLMNGATIGQVATPEPVDTAMCEQIVGDPENIQFVHDMVKEHSGQDYQVLGVCLPPESDDDGADQTH